MTQKPGAPPAEKLVFELSSPGARAIDLPTSDVPEIEFDPALLSSTASGLPELGQLDVVRHFTHLSHNNFSVDANCYPLGSCTMKYNPKVNEWAAALDGFANLHPLQGAEDCQGALAMLYQLRLYLQEIAGLDEVSLQPCAGAHGELAALKVIRAFFVEQGQTARRKVLIPDTAHGTNAASCAMCGLSVITLKANPDGSIDLHDLKSHLTDEIAALMITNPNTLGMFNRQIVEIADLVHAAGAMLYLDGANMNAILGIARPGDFGVDAMHYNLHHTFGTPHGSGGPGAGPIAVCKKLAPYLPAPQVVLKDGQYAWDHNGPRSIGRVRSFWGQFNVLMRAYAYIRACGANGLRNVSETAILSANYLAQRVREAYPRVNGPKEDEPMAANPCAHAFCTIPRAVIDRGVTIMDIAANLIDLGIHPPTVHWPVHDCLLIEPTETESKATLDAFAEALCGIAEKSEHNPESLKRAPVAQTVGRLDEAGAARAPMLRWSPAAG